MNRYSKSIIGLMEQCNDGEWVKYDEAKLYIANQEKAITECEEDKFNDWADNLYEMYNGLVIRSNELEKTNRILIVIILIQTILAAIRMFIK